MEKVQRKQEDGFKGIRSGFPVKVGHEGHWNGWGEFLSRYGGPGQKGAGSAGVGLKGLKPGGKGNTKLMQNSPKNRGGDDGRNGLGVSVWRVLGQGRLREDMALQKRERGIEKKRNKKPNQSLKQSNNEKEGILSTRMKLR